MSSKQNESKAPKKAPKPEQRDTLGVYVTLTIGPHAGEQVLCRPWGFDHIGNNLEVVFDIVADVLEAIEYVGDEETPEGKENASREEVRTAIVTTLQRSWNRMRDLVIASLENGEGDVAKIHGFSDAWDVLEAVVDANGVFEVVGKAQAFGKRLPHNQVMEQAAETMRKTAT